MSYPEDDIIWSTERARNDQLGTKSVISPQVFNQFNSPVMSSVDQLSSSFSQTAGKKQNILILDKWGELKSMFAETLSCFAQKVNIVDCEWPEALSVCKSHKFILIVLSYRLRLSAAFITRIRLLSGADVLVMVGNDQESSSSTDQYLIHEKRSFNAKILSEMIEGKVKIPAVPSKPSLLARRVEPGDPLHIMIIEPSEIVQKLIKQAIQIANPNIKVFATDDFQVAIDNSILTPVAAYFICYKISIDDFILKMHLMKSNAAFVIMVQELITHETAAFLRTTGFELFLTKPVTNKKVYDVLQSLHMTPSQTEMLNRFFSQPEIVVPESVVENEYDVDEWGNTINSKKSSKSGTSIRSGRKRSPRGTIHGNTMIELDQEELQESNISSANSYLQVSNPLLSAPASYASLERKPSAKTRRTFHVLVADDKTASRNSICRSLIKQSDEISYSEANSGDEAIAAVEREKFDMIFLELEFLYHKGEQIAANIRAKGYTGTIIAVTRTLGNMAALKAAGFDDVLVLPVKMEVMKVLVDKWLLKRRSSSKK